MLSREMKDSGVEWIGEIPKEWKLRKLKYLLEERNEKNSPVKTKDILSLSVQRGIFPYSEKVGGGNKAKEDITSYKLTYPGDIVINSMNILAGAVGLSKYFGAVSPVYYTLFADDENINIDYYYSLFLTKEFQKSLLGLGNGIMMKESDNGKLNTIRMRIPLDKLLSLKLPVPSLEEQNRITKYVNERIVLVDKIIYDTQQSIIELKKYKQSLITETVTKGLDNNVEMKDSGIEVLGRINYGYKIIPLGYLGKLQNGISKSGEYFGEGFPFISYSDVYQNRILPKKASNLVRSNLEEQSNYSVKKNDIFFTRTSEIIEEIGMASVCYETIEKATFAGFLIRFRPKSEAFLSEFGRYYLESTFVRDYFSKEMNLVTRASLGQGLLKKLPIVLPDLSEQQQIVDFLDEKISKVDNIIKDKEQIIKEYDEYKKSLIYEYVTGKKQV